MKKELVVAFHCDPCGIDVKLVDVDPKDDEKMNCPYCKSNKFYSFDDYYLVSAKRRQI